MKVMARTMVNVRCPFKSSIGKGKLETPFKNYLCWRPETKRSFMFLSILSVESVYNETIARKWQETGTLQSNVRDSKP